ncbi:MAG: hypothetical protein GY819_16255 [Planctomycetaceae bacterium]|nr:hypothetical protein [Planctomycetaceae bacterium]MCP4464346.1 hypothetical protein [Planctomycetaceae bacterium]MDG1807564.1 carboxymuconolactone decarboxylase family protein [Pirellulaceae bacterium]MDG2105851.1 carboxymuconolactone decarboxylase family protein [Pirellulaceae bacterium]
MAWIDYLPSDAIPEDQRVDDPDNIIQVHGVNAPVMKQHFELYAQLMRRPGPLTLVQREMVAVVVSSMNGCHY